MNPFAKSSNLAVPLRVLLFASGACVTLFCLRILVSGQWHHSFLVWNLILAWLPLLFSIQIVRLEGLGRVPRWKWAALLGGWLAFFPNAPYIFTDLVHLHRWHYHHFWVDMILILLFALTGFLVGFLSLYLVQSVVARRFGAGPGWLFVLFMAGLSGCGVYIGRFLRWNSWDILLNPLGLLRDAHALVTAPLAHRGAFVFPVLFALFLFLAYLMLYGLTHLQPLHARAVHGPETEAA